MAIGLVSLNSNSEMHMTAICDARLIHGGGGDFTGIYMLCNFNGPFLAHIFLKSCKKLNKTISSNILFEVQDLIGPNNQCNKV